MSGRPWHRAGILRPAHPDHAPAPCHRSCGAITIEQGRYSPSLEVAFRIARVFKVPLDEVFQYPGNEGEPS